MNPTSWPDRTARCAAVQLHAVLGDVAANVAACRAAVEAAVRDGARVVVLPEFFTTGVAYRLDVATAAQPVDGWVTDTLHWWAADHQILISGSMLIRDADGDVRNAQLVVGPDGLVGRHDKDLPTMWENALYTNGADNGRIDIPARTIDALPTPVTVGGALCWELTRRDTVRRLAGHVDLVLAGSGWWSVPEWTPRPVFRRWEAANAERAQTAPGLFANLVAAPVVHAAHVGELTSRLPGQPGRYRGHYEGGTGIWDRTGALVAGLPPTSTCPGTATPVVADITVGRGTPPPTPDRYWLTRRGIIPTYAWHWQRLWGRRFYRAHVHQETYQ